jgi:hypothetical protein
MSCRGDPEKQTEARIARLVSVIHSASALSSTNIRSSSTLNMIFSSHHIALRPVSLTLLLMQIYSWALLVLHLFDGGPTQAQGQKASLP